MEEEKGRAGKQKIGKIPNKEEMVRNKRKKEKGKGSIWKNVLSTQ
jgi:hypothetical protein